MFCGTCGNPGIESQRFCWKCGRPGALVTVPSPLTIAPPVQFVPASSPTAKIPTLPSFGLYVLGRHKGLYGFLFFICIVLAVISTLFSVEQLRATGNASPRGFSC